MKALPRVVLLCLLGLMPCAGAVMAQTPPADGITKHASTATKAKPAHHKAVKKGKTAPAPLPEAKLDLRLPTEMVKDLKPVTQDAVTTPKPLLPYLFGEKPPSDSPFQLNGRLLSNEMQLQLRNDARQDIEGAAIEFEFRQ